MLQDTFLHKGLRRKLVEELIEKGITDEAVLDAINKIPRHLFMDNAFLKFAYKDQAFPIGANQTISQPYTVAFQSQLLEVSPREKILEIGTGSGYQACVLLEMGAKVFTIERHRSLYQKSKAQLNKLGYFPRQFFGDGYKGLPAFAPFDKIIITAAAPYLSEELKDQLKVGGMIVVPLGEGESQQMMRYIKVGENEFEEENYGNFSFVPMLHNKSFNT